MAVVVDLDLDLDFDLRGPSVAAEAADQTRRAPHMDVRRFPQRQDASSENPAGSANPMRSIGRVGGVCFLCARFLCTSKERWRSEEHTSELQSLVRISYAVFCLKKKK